MPPQTLHHYLRRATRGLWGRKRAEVWEELQGHILERSQAFRLAGQSEGEALQRVLEELGEPSRVSREMVQLHSLPVVLPLMLCLLVGGFMLTTRQASVLVVRDGPSPFCAQACETDADWAWTGLSGLKRVLEAQQVRWEQADNRIALTFPGDRPVFLDEAYNRAVWKLNRPVFSRGGETYWLTGSLVEAIASRSTLAVKLTGWSEPVLEVGQVRIQLAQGEVWVKRLYRSLLAQRIPKFNPDANIAGYPTYRYVLKVDAEPGSVYAVLSPSVRGYFRSQFAVVGEKGEVEFNLPWKQVGFADLENLGFNQPGQTATVGLLKITGGLDRRAALYQTLTWPVEMGQE